MKCVHCRKDYPSHLVQPMCINGDYLNVCGICALEIRNKMMGLPESMPFGGEMANDIYEETLEYNAERKQ
jgi:hypothetical protein